jgi:hypothetical protein
MSRTKRRDGGRLVMLMAAETNAGGATAARRASTAERIEVRNARPATLGKAPTYAFSRTTGGG